MIWQYLVPNLHECHIEIPFILTHHAFRLNFTLRLVYRGIEYDVFRVYVLCDPEFYWCCEEQIIEKKGIVLIIILAIS
jgi:hypothetical protein